MVGQNRSFWAVFRCGGLVVQHVTPYLLNASTYMYLHVDCISRTANEYSVSKRSQ